jgi:adenosylhomocysteine nucleosidase
VTTRTGPRLALLAPMEMELQAVLDALPSPAWSTDRAGELPVHRTTLERDDGSAAELLALQIGMGTVPAEQATRTLLQHVDVDHVVVLGIAGGVLPSAEIGDLVVVESALHGPTGQTHDATPLGPVPATGVLHTSDLLIQDPGALAELVSQGVVALDMETAAVAHVCEQEDVPWTSFRSISDLAGDESITAEVAALTGPDGMPDLDAITRFLEEDPSRAAALERLGNDAAHAAQVAAEAAIAACRHVGDLPTT